MPEIQEIRNYIQSEAPNILAALQSDQKPNFGILTPHHMVEHLNKVIRFSIKTYGTPPEEPTEAQLGFHKFIYSDRPFPNRNNPNPQLEELRTANLEEAKAGFSASIDKFYQFFNENPDARSYNDFFGSLNQEDLEHFHYKHLKHHFAQFNLI